MKGQVTFPLLLPHPLVKEGLDTFPLLLQCPLIIEGQVTENHIAFLWAIVPPLSVVFFIIA